MFRESNTVRTRWTSEIDRVSTKYEKICSVHRTKIITRLCVKKINNYSREPKCSKVIRVNSWHGRSEDIVNSCRPQTPLTHQVFCFLPRFDFSFRFSVLYGRNRGDIITYRDQQIFVWEFFPRRPPFVCSSIRMFRRTVKIKISTRRLLV